nr:sigma-70 family RNA polymerase sigma factor [Bacteroidota bacterium]
SKNPAEGRFLFMPQRDRSPHHFVKVRSHQVVHRFFELPLCKNNFDADDLVSETILQAFENFHKLKDESKAKQWLFRILHNQFISNYRSRKDLIQIESKANEQNQGLDNFSLFEAIAKSDFVADGNPEKKFISKLTQHNIQHAIDELPEEFRAALVLCDMEEFSYSEIAQILKIPIGTVRSRIARARINLQKKLWVHAKELGIKTSKHVQVKAEYVCACGEEENKTSITIIR